MTIKVPLIINTEKTVSEMENSSKCDEFHVQIGYFWFSGFESKKS